MNQSLKLYFIDKDIEQILENAVENELYDPRTGELLPEVLDKINSLELKKEDLFHNIGLMQLQAKASIGAVDAEIKRLTDIKKSFQTREGTAKKFLQNHIPEGEKFEFENLKISWRKSTAVETKEDLNLESLKVSDPDFVTEKVVFSLDKTLVKNTYKANGILPAGVKVVEKQNIQVK